MFDGEAMPPASVARPCTERAGHGTRPRGVSACWQASVTSGARHQHNWPACGCAGNLEGNAVTAVSRPKMLSATLVGPAGSATAPVVLLHVRAAHTRRTGILDHLAHIRFYVGESEHLRQGRIADSLRAGVDDETERKPNRRHWLRSGRLNRNQILQPPLECARCLLAASRLRKAIDSRSQQSYNT